MATGNIKKQGLIPKATGMVYETNYQISDDTIGKFISLNGARTFYSPGIAETLETPQTGTQTLTSATTVNVQALLEPGNNQLTFVVYLDNKVNTNLTVNVYSNFTLIQGGQTGTNGGTSPQAVQIPSGSTFGSVTIPFFSSLGTQITNIQTIIMSVSPQPTFVNNPNDNSRGSFTATVTYTVSVPSQFSNPLNISDFNISTINFYGANRDTLILQGTKLTS